VPDIPNPFGHVLSRFLYTFNKLHLWNLTQYDRVIYMDADNIVTHRGMLESLFQCGHFCVVFMNPCHFHTGLMVIKPDTTLYNRMVDEIANTGSYDGADQGFLSAFFNKGKPCAEAPVFSPSKGKSEAPVNVLHIGYNMHSLYMLANDDLEMYRCGVFSGSSSSSSSSSSTSGSDKALEEQGQQQQQQQQQLEEDDESVPPMATIAYPVPLIIKPWYWWCFLVGHSQEWNEVRAKLSEPDLVFTELFRAAVIVLLYLLIMVKLDSVTVSEVAQTPGHRRIKNMGPLPSALLFGSLCFAVAIIVGLKVTPSISQPHHGGLLCWIAFFATFHVLARAVGHYVFLQTSTFRSCVPSFYDYRLAFGATLFLFTLNYWRPIFVSLIGYGLHMTILTALLGVVAVVSSHLQIFIHLVFVSPLFSSSLT
jgi:hypothetical protein